MFRKPLKHCPVILQTGFRIFFLGAAVHAVVSMVLWYVFYVAGGEIVTAMPLTVWHGHEMVFGFSMAVVAGFLLTAVMNWTGRETLRGWPLMGLFVVWAAGRVLAFCPSRFWPWLAGTNLLFLIWLLAVVTIPVAAERQWRQSAVLSKVILIAVSGWFFYQALMQNHLDSERKALRFAVYMLISLIFTIGRRVIPFFTEKGVGYPVQLRNSILCDRLSLVFLVLFSLLDVFWPQPVVIVSLCLGLGAAHAVRLHGWWTPGVLKKPLLWILFVGYAFLILGFLLKVVSVFRGLPDDAALHAWTAGGVGIFTLGMMARVAWGHTGRPIGQPPRGVGVIFALIVLSAALRLCSPFLSGPLDYATLVGSQIFWVLAFAGYGVIYAPVLIRPRPDGRWG